MPNRRSISSSTPWESIVGYSRAVRVGNIIHVSGTTATDTDGIVIGIDDAYAQTIQIIENIRSALLRLDACLEDIVRTRIYVTDISQWSEIAKAHLQYFAEIRPATSMVQVAKLISPEMLVEIEADAIVQSE